MGRRPLEGPLVNGTIIPPASRTANVGGAGTAWAAERAMFHRFTLERPHVVRYAMWKMGGTSSGNIQQGIVRLSGTAHLTARRVCHTGVVACPAANTNFRLNMGPTLLRPGEYAGFFWCDNATATFLTSSASVLTATQQSAFVNTLTGGVPDTSFSVGTWDNWTFMSWLGFAGDF